MLTLVEITGKCIDICLAGHGDSRYAECEKELLNTGYVVLGRYGVGLPSSPKILYKHDSGVYAVTPDYDAAEALVTDLRMPYADALRHSIFGSFG